MAILGKKFKEFTDTMQEVANNHNKKRQPVAN